MSTQESLLKEIASFCERHGMAETAFGLAAVRDGHMVRRLRESGSMTVKRLDQVLAFMRERDRASGFDVAIQLVGEHEPSPPDERTAA